MWQKNVRYLDYNASSGVTGLVRQKLNELLNRHDFYFANPSSLHRLGQQSQQYLRKCASTIASSFGDEVNESQIVFTSSGTEANQTVIRSAMKTAEVIIIGAGEHSASHDLLSEIPEGIRKVELPLLSNGQYDQEFLKELLNDVKQSGCLNVFLSLFWANNETGVLNPISKLGEILSGSGVHVSLHLDGAQVWGKLPLQLLQTPADFVTFSGHKIGAPAGIGVIWVRPGKKLHPLILGSQSNGLRGGTENLISVAALSFAVESMNTEIFVKRTSALRDQLEVGLKELGLPIWGEDADRITNTCRFSIPGFKNYQNWIERLDLMGFAVSHGSACKSKLIEPSRVLLKMGVNREEALNAIRVSFGPTNEPSDVDEFIMAFRAILSEKSSRT